MKEFLNYFAGIVDGEGTIGIAKVKRKLKDNRQGYAYRTFFHITNTHLPMLQYLQKHIGGKISYLDERAQAYNMTFSANKIRELFPDLIPYLLIKKRQAEIVLEFLAKIKETNFCSPSDEIYDFYEKCFVECKKLKQERWNYEIKRTPVGMLKCKQCNREFIAYSNSHKYCCHYCKKHARWIRSNKTQKLNRCEKVREISQTPLLLGGK